MRNLAWTVPSMRERYGMRVCDLCTAGADEGNNEWSEANDGEAQAEDKDKEVERDEWEVDLVASLSSQSYHLVALHERS